MTSAFSKASGNVPVSMALLSIPAIVTDITGLVLVEFCLGQLPFLDLVSVRFWLPHFRLCA